MSEREGGSSTGGRKGGDGIQVDGSEENCTLSKERGEKAVGARTLSVEGGGKIEGEHVECGGRREGTGGEYIKCGGRIERGGMTRVEGGLMGRVHCVWREEGGLRESALNVERGGRAEGESTSVRSEG